jgi:hypothetical protein
MRGVVLLSAAVAMIFIGLWLDRARQPRTTWSFPRGGAELPDLRHRVAVFLWVLIPWTMTWFGTQALGRPHGAFSTMLPFERSWPVWQWTEAIYMSAYLFIPCAAMLLRTQYALRRLAVTGAVATLIVTFCWLTIPVVAENRVFEPAHALGRFLAFEQGHSIGVAAFPAFHVLWSLLAADAWVVDARLRGERWPGVVAWTWAVLIALSCITTSMHTVIDLAAALVVFTIVRGRGSEGRVTGAAVSGRRQAEPAHVAPSPLPPDVVA